MRLPKDLLTQTYTRPRLFLCETDKKKICELDAMDLNGNFKFNAYSELSFTSLIPSLSMSGSCISKYPKPSRYTNLSAWILS